MEMMNDVDQIAMFRCENLASCEDRVKVSFICYEGWGIHMYLGQSPLYCLLVELLHLLPCLLCMGQTGLQLEVGIM